jgi:FHA domain
VATCPSGHQSASDDFCDVCGVLIGAAPSLGPGLDPDAGPATGPGNGTAGGSAAEGSAGGTEPGGTAAATALRWSESCPRCGTPRDGQFCENCGYNFAAPPGGAVPAAPVPPPPAPAAQLPGTPVPGAQVPDAQAASAPVRAAQVPDAWAASAQPADPQATFDPWPAVSTPAGPVPGGAVPGGASPGSPPPAYGSGAAAPVAPNPAPSVPAAPAGTAWTAVVSADRAYYDAIQAAGGPDAAGIEFPAYCPQRRFPLDRAEIRIGRHSASSGISPEIDLSVAPADPGISRLHAVLLRAADGSWTIVDPGSANGTLLNGTELAPGQVVPVRDGDRIHLGAWTELRLTCGA